MIDKDIQNPINAFPLIIQEIISHYCEVKGYPIEFFSTAILSAVSTSMGRSVVLDTGNFTAIGIVWAAIVGKPGLTKSEAQKDAFKPIFKMQFDELSDHQRAIDMCSSEKEIKQVPEPKRFLLNDTTPESLVITLANNPKGCGIIYDELAGFLGRFDRYSSGADEQMYLSLFNGDSIMRTRVKSETNASAKNSYLTIIGTIQPSVMSKFFSGKSDSGFFDRWILCYPENVKKQYPSAYGIEPEIEQAYSNLIQNISLIGFDDYLEPKRMTYNDESYTIINQFQRAIIDRENETESDTERAILAKLEIYLHRFALLLQICQFGATADSSKIYEVSKEAAEGAVILTKYYFSEANKIRIMPSSDNLSGKWKVIYDSLPDHGTEFNRATFIDFCAAHGIKQRSADNFLKENASKSESTLFFKTKQGVYTKNL